jgi:hypothetical protein
VREREVESAKIPRQHVVREKNMPVKENGRRKQKEIRRKALEHPF